MKGLTYPDLAARYEVDVCFDGCFRDHSRGMVDGHGTIHWRNRSVTRSGLRRFLMLIAETQRREWQDGAGQPLPFRRWQSAIDLHHDSMFAYRTALHDLGVRLPAALAEKDRAKVRALLATAPHELRDSRVGRWAGMR